MMTKLLVREMRWISPTLISDVMAAQSAGLVEYFMITLGWRLLVYNNGVKEVW